MTLDDVLRAPLTGRVDDVVERLQAIEEVLPERDGVRAFTALDRVVPLDRLVGLASRCLLRRVV
jgi:hypothetical protein